MRSVRSAITATAFSTAFAVALWIPGTRVHADGPATSLVGAWTLNRDLSDTGQLLDQARGGGGRGGGRGGGYGRGGGRGGGFPGGGGGQYPGGGGNRGGDPQETERRMSALRDILYAPDHLTITQTESMVIVTTSDGRTTRYALDWKKSKDESTSTERRSKWEASKLVSEVTGSSQPKVTEYYSVDPEHHELLVIVYVEGEGREVAHAFHRIYTVTPQK